MQLKCLWINAVSLVDNLEPVTSIVAADDDSGFEVNNSSLTVQGCDLNILPIIYTVFTAMYPFLITL